MSNKLKVSLRNGFSDRMGIKIENTEIQLTELDHRTRIALVNAVDYVYLFVYKQCKWTDPYSKDRQFDLLHEDILSEVYVQQVDHSKTYYALDIVYNTIKSDEYDDVLTVIEYVVKRLNGLYIGSKKEGPYTYFNYVFEQEFVGYRFVNEQIVPITNEIEIDAIEKASDSPYTQVNNHLSKSLGLLSNRDNPDYENSIKESISAVECICSIIVGEPTSLGKALGKIQHAGINIHPSMRTAFDKLYEYTSKEKGIRHSGQLGGPQSTFEEAKFMLISCCAFVNYLIGNMGKCE